MRMRFWLLGCCLLLAGCAAEHQVVREDARLEREVFLPAELQHGEGWSAETLEEGGWDVSFVESGAANEVELVMARRPPRRERGGPSGRPAPPLLNPRPTREQREAMRRRSEDVIAVQLARTRYHEALKEARARYPEHQGYQNHHLVPIYLGGARDGVTYRLHSAYHQAITQEFRGQWAYGQSTRPNRDQLQQILLDVYSKYPIPQLIGITP